MVGSIAAEEKVGLFKLKYLKILILAFVCIISIYAFMLFLNEYFEKNTFEQQLISEGRNYEQAPFDMIDAAHFCKLKIQIRYGDQLTQSYVDDNSTRIDTISGIYKVFMIATVGDTINQEEKSVHCFVDPTQKEVTHFRILDRYSTSLVSKALKFFK